MKRILLSILGLLPAVAVAEKHIPIEVVIANDVGFDLKAEKQMAEFALATLSDSMGMVLDPEFYTYKSTSGLRSYVEEPGSRDIEVHTWEEKVDSDKPKKARFRIVLAPLMESKTSDSKYFAGQASFLCNGGQGRKGVAVVNATPSLDQKREERWTKGAAGIQHELLHLMGASHRPNSLDVMNPNVYIQAAVWTPGYLMLDKSTKHEVLQCLKIKVGK